LNRKLLSLNPEPNPLNPKRLALNPKPNWAEARPCGLA
jgi:hypothetical protein